MSETEIPSEVDIHSHEGLTRLFQFGISFRNQEDDLASLKLLEERFDLAAYAPPIRGALEDTVRHLDSLGNDERFDKVLGLIAGVIGQEMALSPELAADIAQISNAARIVRFSFRPALIPCLLRARVAATDRGKHAPSYAVRFAGIGDDAPLLAVAALFLGLRLYAEDNPPWVLKAIIEDNEPLTENPNLEITFPPAEFRAENGAQLEESVRRTQIPRAVDRGKFDLESVMLDYLFAADSPSLAFVSESFVSSTRQSRLLTRQRLLESGRISRVSEINTASPRQFLIKLGATYGANETIQMVSADTVHRFTGMELYQRNLRGKSDVVAVDEILAAGGSLAPSRYLGKGPTGGRSLSDNFQNTYKPTRHRLADFFEIIRPKTTKADPVGTLQLREVRAGDLTENGEISGASRQINIRATLERGLEEQLLKPGDVLFAHRAPVGRVAYVNGNEVDASKIWAAQSLLIFRSRRSTTAKDGLRYCDPRVLFMYLLTTKVRSNWSKLAIGDRSPAIPIGEIERFGLPNNLLLPKKPNEPIDATLPPENYTALMVAAFKIRQIKLAEIHDIEASMSEGLEQVWETAWSKSLGSP